MATNTKFPNYNYVQFNKHGIVHPQFHNWVKPNQVVAQQQQSTESNNVKEEASLVMQTLYPGEDEFQGSKLNASSSEVQFPSGTFDVYKFFKKP